MKSYVYLLRFYDKPQTVQTDSFVGLGIKCIIHICRQEQRNTNNYTIHYLVTHWTRFFCNDAQLVSFVLQIKNTFSGAILNLWLREGCFCFSDSDLTRRNCQSPVRAEHVPVARWSRGPQHVSVLEPHVDACATRRRCTFDPLHSLHRYINSNVISKRGI